MAFCGCVLFVVFLVCLIGAAYVFYFRKVCLVICVALSNSCSLAFWGMNSCSIFLPRFLSLSSA